MSRRSWRCGLRRKNQCFLLWQSDLENGVQPACEVDWFFFFTCVNQKLTSLSESTCSDPHVKINQVICFIHGPTVSATVLVPTLNLCISQGHTKIRHSSSFLSIQDGAKWIRGVFPLISVGLWGLDFLLWCTKQLKVKNTPFNNTRAILKNNRRKLNFRNKIPLNFPLCSILGCSLEQSKSCVLSMWVRYKHYKCSA